MRIPLLRGARSKTTDWKSTSFVQIGFGDEHKALVSTLATWSHKPVGEYMFSKLLEDAVR